MARALLASSPLSVIVENHDGTLALRNAGRPDKAIVHKTKQIFLEAARVKWGMIPVRGNPEIGDGLPVLRFSDGQYEVKP